MDYLCFWLQTFLRLVLLFSTFSSANSYIFNGHTPCLSILFKCVFFTLFRNELPPSSSIKCIDIWLLSCILFVFAALLEYACILYFMRKEQCSNNNWIPRVSRLTRLRVADVVASKVRQKCAIDKH